MMAETQEQPHPMEVDVHEVRAKLERAEDFLLLDCREADEWEMAHIDGALLVPMSEMQDRVGELDGYKQNEIVVHCHHGGRSLRVAYWLNNQGFSNVRSMSGGIDVWSQEIDPAVPRY